MSLVPKSRWAGPLLAAAAIAAMFAGALAETAGEQLTTEAILPICGDLNRDSWPFKGLTPAYSEIMWMTQKLAASSRENPIDWQEESGRDKKGRAVRFALPRPQTDGSDSSTYREVLPNEHPPFEDEAICISVLRNDDWGEILVAASLPPRNFRERRIVAWASATVGYTWGISPDDFAITSDDAEAAAHADDTDLAEALQHDEPLNPRRGSPLLTVKQTMEPASGWDSFPGLLDALWGTIVRVGVHLPGVQGRVLFLPQLHSNMLRVARTAHFQVCRRVGGSLVYKDRLAPVYRYNPNTRRRLRIDNSMHYLLGMTLRDAFSQEVDNARIAKSALAPLPLCATSATLAWSARTRPRVCDGGALSAGVPAPRLCNKGRFPLKSVLRVRLDSPQRTPPPPPEGLLDGAESEQGTQRRMHFVAGSQLLFGRDERHGDDYAAGSDDDYEHVQAPASLDESDELENGGNVHIPDWDATGRHWFDRLAPLSDA